MRNKNKGKKQHKRDAKWISGTLKYVTQKLSREIARLSEISFRLTPGDGNMEQKRRLKSPNFFFPPKGPRPIGPTVLKIAD